MGHVHQPDRHPAAVTAGESRMIDTGEIALHVTTYPGNGPALLLVHGIGSSGAGWVPVIDDLAAEFTLITLDLRGHGESDKPPHGYLYEDYIRDIDGLLAALHIDRPLIIGHSLGGILTLWWAARHPDRAAALVIEDSPLRSGEDFRPAFDGWLKLNALSLPELRHYYASEYPAWPPAMIEARARDMAGTSRAVFAELREDSLANHGVDRLREIEGITSPLLLIHGDVETGGMVHPEDIAELPRRLPQAQTIRIPGGGHTLHRSHREEFLAAALPFLREHAPATTSRGVNP
jgi:pimeloyl-ACP methyl ester carboxylesterase